MVFNKGYHTRRQERTLGGGFGIWIPLHRWLFKNYILANVFFFLYIYNTIGHKVFEFFILYTRILIRKCKCLRTTVERGGRRRFAGHRDLRGYRSFRHGAPGVQDSRRSDQGQRQTTPRSDSAHGYVGQSLGRVAGPIASVRCRSEYRCRGFWFRTGKRLFSSLLFFFGLLSLCSSTFPADNVGR